MRASVWLEAVDRHRPEVLTACRDALGGAKGAGRFLHLDAAAMERCPRDSVDYAVMERLGPLRPGAGRRVARGHRGPGRGGVPLDTDWSDVGSWATWLDVTRGGNVNATVGDVFVHRSTNCLLHAEHRLLAAVGLSDTVVVETADAVLVAHRDAAQNVDEVVGWLEARHRKESRSHRRVYRPWGSFEQLDAGEGYQVKRLSGEAGRGAVAAKAPPPLRTLGGGARQRQGDAGGTRNASSAENESIDIPVGTIHRSPTPEAIPSRSSRCSREATWARTTSCVSRTATTGRVSPHRRAS